ncbi:class I SAM-dependent rRNA methyltransferase [Nannocystaceae bacterium ST9]
MSVRVELRRDAGKIEPAGGPWIRREQVARVLGPPDPLAIAELVDHRGTTLGFGVYSPESAIVLRMLSFGGAAPARDWLARRIERALAARAALGLEREGTTGYREINSEGDGLPGLVVDRFGEVRVVQITTAPMAARREAIVAALREVPGLIVIAPDSAASREGFTAGLESFGAIEGPLRWREHGLTFTAPSPAALGSFQKTGGYHDQRDNRARVAALLGGSPIAGPLVDLGTHVGGFALAAAKRGREVIAIDQSRELLGYVERNAEANGLRVTPLAADMFGELGEPTLRGPFAALVFDPPKIANSRRELPRALGAMTRTLAKLAPRVAEGGFVVVCSCSHHLDGEQLDRAMLELATRGQAWTRIAAWGPGMDHPVWPGHREGEYLRVRVYQRR